MAKPTSIRQSIEALSPQVARALRRQTWAEMFAFALAVFIASLVIDRWAELPWFLRAAALLAAVVYGVRLFLRGRRRAKHYSVDELAATVESYEPELEGKLMSSLDLADEWRRLQAMPGRELETKLMERAIRESRSAARAVNLGRVLNLWAVRGWMFAVLVLGATAFLAAENYRDDLGLWFRRNVLLSTESWPAESRILLENAALDWHVARDDPLEISAWVVGQIPSDISLVREASGSTRSVRLLPEPPRRVPEEILERALQRTDGRVLSRDELRSLERAGEGRRVRHVTGPISEPFSFRVESSGDETPLVNVVVHERPRVRSVALRLRFPDYLGKAALEMENPGAEIVVPAGTTIELAGKSDQTLGSAVVIYDDETLEQIIVEGDSFAVAWVPEESGALELSVRSLEWDLASKAPRRYAVVVLPDRAPTVSLVLDDDTRVATPSGQITMTSIAEDDHAISSWVFRRTVQPAGDPRPLDELPYVDVPLAWEAEALRRTDNGVEIELTHRLDLQPLQLTPGTDVVIQMIVRDNDTRAEGGPKWGESRREVIRIVRTGHAARGGGEGARRDPRKTG